VTVDRKSSQWCSVTGGSVLPVKIHGLVCGIVWFVMFFLPGCSGCLSKAVENSAKDQPQTQQKRQEEQQQPTAGKPGSPDTVTATGQPSQSDAGPLKKPMDPLGPGESFLEATSLYRRAQQKSNAADAAGAFTDATAAWNLVRKFPKDPDCRRLEEELAGQLGKLAKKANQKAGGRSAIDGKTLIEE
jgi:hypothetical protein